METNDNLIMEKVTSIKVRMYCHGFGDCFLLTFREGDTPVFRMLVDCGMLTGKTELMKQAIINIKEECKGRLDLVVQTHEHKDHVSGFNIKDDDKLLWDSIQVDNVWLAWTENIGPNGDDLANQLKEKQKKKTHALANAISFYKQVINKDEYKNILQNEFKGKEYLAAQERYGIALEQILNFFDISLDKNYLPQDGGSNKPLNGSNSALLGLTIEKAMGYFVERKADKNRPDNMRPNITFWNPGEMAEEKQTGLKGINFYFLGPPKDYNRLRLMEDKTHKEMYMTELGLSDNFYVALNTDEEESKGLSPFNPKYFLRKEDITESQLAFDINNKDHVWNLYYWNNKKDEWSDNGWRTIEIDWLNNTGALALHLDSYTNNTSLAFAIEFIESGKILLFPGDAQIGNWISWTEPKDETEKEPKLKWNIKKNGSMDAVTVEHLLNRTVFYKVGHHASHNATAKEHGLELMVDDDLVAMIPVDEEVAKKQGKKGWKMPAEDLYKRLQEKTKGRIIRLDKGNILDNPEKLYQGANPSQRQINVFKNHISKSDIDIEYTEGQKRPLYYEYTVEG